MQLTRGSGVRAGDELLVQAPGDGGIAIVSLATDLPASRYRGLAWDVADLPPNVQVRVLWFSDTDPGRVNSLPAIVEAGRVRPVIVAGASGWMGRIRGLGLSVAGALPRPYRVSAVSAKPMGAAELLSDRAAEWLSFEGWNGASINVVVGGSAVQDLPLPAAVGLAVGIAILLLLLIHRLRPALLPHVGIGVAVVFLGGWLVLDLRWSANLARQVALTTSTFAGKDDRDRRLADVDGVLYEFIDRARAVLPPHAAAGLGRLGRALLQRSCRLPPVPAQRALPAARSRDARSRLHQARRLAAGVQPARRRIQRPQRDGALGRRGRTAGGTEAPRQRRRTVPIQVTR